MGQCGEHVLAPHRAGWQRQVWSLPPGAAERQEKWRWREEWREREGEQMGQPSAGGKEIEGDEKRKEDGALERRR